MNPIKEWQAPSREIFEAEILPRQQPAILRNLLQHWPSVALGQRGPEELCTYLMQQDNGHGVDAILLAPQEKGRVFYKHDMSGFNFARKRISLSAAIEQLVRYSHFAEAPALAVQSAVIADCLPKFLAQHPMPILSEQRLASSAPRIWLGSEVVTPAHFDESNNLACVVAGKRRFTLFPPEQVSNLYIGPLDFAPTPTPISMADLRQPDFARFPRLKTALAHAQVAELSAGDAIYIPPLWWHQVESLAFFNLLINFWWQEYAPVAEQKSPLVCMLECLKHMQALPQDLKQSWQAMFAHYVFAANGDPAEHIPTDKRGVLAARQAQEDASS